jgi:centromere protein W
MASRLMREATINAKQAGERGISAKSVKKVTEASSTVLDFLGAS